MSKNNKNIKKELKLLSNHTFIYGMGNLFNRVIGFLMIPIYTRFLSPADYGVLEIVTLTTQIITIIAATGITQSVGRFYFQYDTDIDRREVLSTSIFTFSLLSLVILVPLILASPVLSKFLLNTPRQEELFSVAIAGVWFATLSQIGFMYLRILKKSFQFMIFSLVKLAFALSLNIYFLVILKTGVIGILYSTLISAAVFAIILTIPILKHTGFIFSASKAKEILRFGLPLVPSSISNMVVLVSDRFFLRFLVSLTDTGLYSLAGRFAVIPGHFIVYPFMQIWSVRRLEIYKRSNSERVMGQIFSYFCLLVSFVGLAISVLAKDVLKIMAAPEFWAAYKVIPLLVISQVILSFFQHFNLGIIIHKKTHYFAYIDIFNACINLVLNYFLIKKFGMMGAAYATLISYTLRVVLVYIITIPLYRIYFEAIRIIKIFISTGIVYVIGSIANLENIILSLTLKCGILFMFPLLLFISGFFTSDELSWVKRFIAKKSLILRKANQ